jgi:hypothetical protein
MNRSSNQPSILIQAIAIARKYRGMKKEVRSLEDQLRTIKGQSRPMAFLGWQECPNNK